MNTSPTPTPMPMTCPLAKETGTEIVSPTGSELTSITLDVEQANDDDASAVDASPKAKTMKEVILRCGRGLAVSVVIAIALAGKGFVARAHNDPPGTDDMMMNADLGIDSDSSKQVALLDGNGDGKNVAGYDLTKVDDGVSTVRTLQAPPPITFTNVGDGACRDSNNNGFDFILLSPIADVDACKTQCALCPGQGQAAGRELRGIYYYAGGGSPQCSCLLDDGGLFDASVCTGAIYASTTNSGTGAICNLTPPAPEDPSKCWKVVDSTSQCPGAPTNEPTASPTASPTAPPTASPTASPTSSPTSSKSAKVAKKVKSSKVTEVNELGAAAANLQVQQMKSGGSSFSISHPLVGVLALIVFSNLLP